MLGDYDRGVQRQIGAPEVRAGLSEVIASADD